MPLEGQDREVPHTGWRAEGGLIGERLFFRLV